MSKLRRMGRVFIAGLTGSALVACGGSGGGNLTTTTTTDLPNSVAVMVDAGPAVLAAQNAAAANMLFVSVTVCTPGSTTACQTIDHVQVDTGSVGLRIMASALDGTAQPATLSDPGSGQPIDECMQFADGYVWGSVDTADVDIGGRSFGTMPVHVMGDPAAGAAPSDCVLGPEEDTVLQFGANGVLGVGNFLQDCGSACVASAQSATYYSCSAGNCQARAEPLDHQIPNPVGMLAQDNNGVLIQLPSVPEPGAAAVTGTLYFGIATQSDNQLGGAIVYALDAAGTLVTVVNGVAQSQSVIDSGSNGYFFASSSLPTCTDLSGFYCPVATSGYGSVSESATIQGINGLQDPLTFTVDNADSLLALPDTAYPGLAGTNSSTAGTATGFAWGLPFFFGRGVYVLLENQALSGIVGPAVAF